MKNLYKIEDELYIISDKEKSSYCIKECPMSGLNIDKCDCPIQGGCSNKVGTIILTTNKLLIKDGVQAIDDKFLEWFVKNPSCDEIEVKMNQGRYFDYGGNVHITNAYKIIIPKEEHKQELPKTEIDWSGFPKSTQKKVGFTELNIINDWLEENGDPEIAKQVEEEARELCKQETLEEASERFSKQGSWQCPVSFEKGAEWKQQQNNKLYSEKDIMNALHSVELKYNRDFTKIYEGVLEYLKQFKKK
jgi:hypothetical protein